MSDPIIGAIGAALVTGAVDGVSQVGNALLASLVQMVRGKPGGTGLPQPCAGEIPAGGYAQPEAVQAELGEAVAADATFAGELHRLWQLIQQDLKRAAAGGGVTNTVVGNIGGCLVQANTVHGSVSFGAGMKGMAMAPDVHTILSGISAPSVQAREVHVHWLRNPGQKLIARPLLSFPGTAVDRTAALPTLDRVLARPTDRHRLTVITGRASIGPSALAFGWVRLTIYDTLDARRGQLTDRYTKAITQLASDKITERIGGAYALEHLMVESARDHDTVVEVLAAFVREQTGTGEGMFPQEPEHVHQGPRPAYRTLATDVQAALTVLGRRPQQRERNPLNLMLADLCGADLADLRLDHANLWGAKLQNVVMHGVQLQDANLSWAQVQDSRRGRAQMQGAHLSGARLRDATLNDAQMQGADLCDAQLLYVMRSCRTAI